MIGGFNRKTKRSNIRKMITTEGSDEEDGEETAETPVLKHVASAPVISAMKTKIKKNKSVLSFEDEFQNEEEFVIKRSKASLNLQDQVKKEKRRNKKQTGTSNGNSQSKVLTEKASNEPLKQKGLIIKTFNDDELEAEEGDTEHKFKIGARFGAPGDIPDAATIYAMKKKREHARQFSGQANYIPLNSNKHDGRFALDKSRLIREEMDDSSDEERIEMKGSTSVSHPAIERRKQVAKALEEAQGESDQDQKDGDDEEFQRWEDEQIKKGSQIPTQQPGSYGPSISDTNETAMVTNSSVHMAAMSIQSSYSYVPTIPSGYAPQMYNSMYSVPTVKNEDMNVDLVVQKLSEQLDTKKQLHRMHEQQRDKTKFDLQSSTENIINLERKAGDTSDRFSFYQDIRGFVKDLIECLSEKVKKINSLEDSMHQVLCKQAEKLISRRQNDVKDEVDEIGGKMNTESDRVNNIRNRRIAEREGRRTRRREQRLAKESTHNDGMSSDDEMLTSDSLRIDAEKSKIMAEASQLFDDVVIDFSSIQEIASRFEQWKYGFSDSYKDAYLGLCLPKLFNPFIKLQLLNWNPLEINGGLDFEEMQWYLSLVLYGDHGGEMEIEDEDLKLLPNIIEKVLIPKLTVLVKDVWDPLSSKQTKLLTFLFQRLVDDFPTVTKGSKQTKLLVESIVTKLKTSVETEIYIPLYPHTMLETKNSHALAFLERQFFKGVKLLGNLLEWNWLLSHKKLQQLGIDAIVNRYLIIGLQQFPDHLSSLEKAKMIVNCLPKEWFEKSDLIIPGLESFARYLTTLAGNVYKSSLGYSNEFERKKAILIIKKIISLLMHIQAFDEARTVSITYKDDLRKEKYKDSPTNSPVR